jgi:hypothetical protein
MIRRGSFPDRWYAEVIRSRLVKGACRELLSLIAVRHISPRGDVAVSRETLAEELGLPVQQISNRILEATRAGLLVRVDGGHNGRQARYRACIPPPVGSATAEPTEVRRLLIPFKQHADVGSATVEPTEVVTGDVGSATAEPQRARARALLTNPTQPPSTTAGDVAPPADGDRGTRRPRLAAAPATAERDGQDRLGDYLAGRSRLSTEVEQGNHRTRARMNGRKIR